TLLRDLCPALLAPAILSLLETLPDTVDLLQTALEPPAQQLVGLVLACQLRRRDQTFEVAAVRRTIIVGLLEGRHILRQTAPQRLQLLQIAGTGLLARLARLCYDYLISHDPLPSQSPRLAGHPFVSSVPHRAWT